MFSEIILPPAMASEKALAIADAEEGQMGKVLAWAFLNLPIEDVEGGQGWSYEFRELILRHSLRYTLNVDFHRSDSGVSDAGWHIGTRGSSISGADTGSSGTGSSSHCRGCSPLLGNKKSIGWETRSPAFSFSGEQGSGTELDGCC